MEYSLSKVLKTIIEKPAVVETVPLTHNTTYISSVNPYNRLKINGKIATLFISVSTKEISQQNEYLTIETFDPAYAPATDVYFIVLERNTEASHYITVASTGEIQIYPRAKGIPNGTILRGSVSWVIGE